MVLSDIHGNWEALQAVLKAAAGEYDQIVCCGDLVGYGADPNPVVEWTVANVQHCVRGNHDRACAGLEDLEWFNPVAKAAALWTQGQLTESNTQFVRELPKGPMVVDGFEIVHGSPLDEDEYLITLKDATEAFRYVQGSVVFFGHTHIQGGFSWRTRKIEAIGRPAPDQARVLLDLDQDRAFLINPGSVGQPRDGDPRAGYVLLDTENHMLFYCRIAYDIAAAQRKIRAAGLPDVLAVRLSRGR